MAKKKPAAEKPKKPAKGKPKPAASRKVKAEDDDVSVLLPASFIKISSTSLDVDNNLTVNGCFQAAAGTTPAINVSYFNSDTGETGAVTATITGNQFTATIALPDDGLYYIQATLLDTSTDPPTELASDATTVDTDDEVVVDPGD